MSDSLPPHGGPDPLDGWDLEGLLSGENVWLPGGMRPVAVTLASLRSAPMRAELDGEAQARAAFRGIMLPGGSGPARPGGGAGDARTLILPAGAADAGPHVATRPRHSHRRPPRRGRWRSKALVGGVGGAAAVVLVGGIALAGVFSGVGGHPGLLGHSSGASSAAPRTSHPGSNGLDGTATKEPTAHPTPSRSAGQQSPAGSGTASGPSELCRQYLEFIARPESQSDQAAESGDYQHLSNLAGGAWHILGYCMQLQPWAMTQQGSESYPGGLGFPPADSQDLPGVGGSLGQDRGSQQHAGSGIGNGGSVGNGNNQSANGGLGNQGQP
jgi:hypothetical protein